MSALNAMPQGALIHVFEKAFMDAFDDSFDDAANAAQKNYRAVLSAMSRPGSIVSLNHIPKLPTQVITHSEAEAHRMAGLLALARTLCDADTPLWLDAPLRQPALAQYLRFHCSAPIMADNQSQESAFAFIADAQNMPHLHAFNQGSMDSPEKATTVIIACPLKRAAELNEWPRHSTQNSLRLPFTEHSIEMLPIWFWDDISANRAYYPLGVDCIFVDAHAQGVHIMALPRFVRI